jgi:MFS family permease
MLPGLIAAGIGVGFVLPSLASAAASSVPRERFATGSAIYTMTRQLGYVLGVSILVAVLGTPGRVDRLTAFDRGWAFMVIASALGAAAALFIGTVHIPAAAPEADPAQELRKRSAYGSPKPSTSSVAMISRIPSGTRCAGSNPSSDAIRSKPTL